MPGPSARRTPKRTLVPLAVLVLSLLLMPPAAADPTGGAVDAVLDEAANQVPLFRPHREALEDAEDGEFSHCLRAYTPNIGPLRSRSVLPFTPCAGNDVEGCVLWVGFIGYACLKEQ